MTTSFIDIQSTQITDVGAVGSYPSSAAQIEAAVGFGVFTGGWQLNDAGSPLLRSFGPTDLTYVAGTVHYQQTGYRGDLGVTFASAAGTYLQGGNNFNVGSGDGLIFAWQGNQVSLPLAYRGIVNKFSSVGGDPWWAVVSDSDGSMFIEVQNSSGTNVLAAATTILNEPHVGIAVIDRTAGKIQLGLRGLVTGTVSLSPVVALTGAGTDSYSNTQPFTFGSLVGALDAVDNMVIDAMWIGTGPNVADNVSGANMSTALLNLASYVSKLSYTVAAPNGIQEGDLLYLTTLLDTGATLTPPDSTWKQHATFTLGAIAGVSWFKYAGASEAAAYAFGLSLFSTARWSVLAAYRGVVQNTTFDPVHYPFGFFAPAGGTEAAHTGTGTSLTSVTGSSPQTFVTFSRVLYLFAQYDSAAGSPYLDDESPDISLRLRAANSRIDLMFCDNEQPTIVAPAPNETVHASTSLPWVVFSVVIEPLTGSAGTNDNYKAKILRHMLPPPYNQDFSSTISKVLTTIGQSDNIIGGLFGAADFLPDEG